MLILMIVMLTLIATMLVLPLSIKDGHDNNNNTHDANINHTDATSHKLCTTTSYNNGDQQ